MVDAGLNWAKILKFIGFGRNMEWILILQCSFNNLAKMKKTFILSVEKGVAGEMIHICSGYLVKITFSIQFSSCTSLYICFICIFLWNFKMFEELEPSSRLMFEKCLCSDIFCRHETKSRGGGMLILNFSLKFSDVPVQTKLCIFRQTNRIFTSSGLFSSCTPCYTELKPTLQPKSMSMILYSPFSYICHIPCGNLVGHCWVEIDSRDQGESFHSWVNFVNAEIVHQTSG